MSFWCKHIAALLLFSLVTLVSCGQANNKVFQVLEDMNMLYAEVENPFTVNIAGIDPKDVRVIYSGNGELRTLAKGHYTLLPHYYKNESDTVYIITYVKGTFYDSSIYRLRQVPDPDIFLIAQEQISPNFIPLRDISLIDSVSVYHNHARNFPLDYLKYRILKYKLIYYTNFNYQTSTFGQATEFEASGCKIPKEVKDLLKNAKIGDAVKIEILEILGPGQIGILDHHLINHHEII